MKLIDKNAIVAEIERNLCICAIMISQHQNENCVESYKQKAEVYQRMRSFIDTLEVKEVDLEKEIKRFTMSKELYEADSLIKDCKEPASQNDFKPYQKVLARMEDGESWEADLFGTYKPLCDNPYHCVGGWWPQCIPYEGNEHLLGTHNNCDKYYVTWEE